MIFELFEDTVKMVFIVFCLHAVFRSFVRLRLSLKDAREQVRQDRAQIERGIDVTAAKQAEKALQLEVPTVQRLGEVWFAKYIQPRYKHPEVVARVLHLHQLRNNAQHHTIRSQIVHAQRRPCSLFRKLRVFRVILLNLAA